MTRREQWLPVVDAERCTGCAACVNFCPAACLAIPSDSAVLVNPLDCRGDGRCTRVCPQHALRMAWVRPRRERQSPSAA